jgi:hypothetical protein
LGAVEVGRRDGRYAPHQRSLDGGKRSPDRSPVIGSSFDLVIGFQPVSQRIDIIAQFRTKSSTRR